MDGLPPDRAVPLGSRQDRAGDAPDEADGRRRRPAAARADDRARAGPGREWFRRAPRRGVQVEDHREEERYSHIDLVDFEANVEGAKAAYQSVRDLVQARRPALAKEIDDRFADVSAALEPYRRGTGFVAYTALTKADTRGLSRSIDALAEPLSEVGAVVAGQ